MKIKISKRKKIILLLSSTVVLVPSIATPIIVINNQKKQKNAENKKDVKTVIKILEKKSLSERQIELNSDAKGKIIANNQKKIIEKIKEIITNKNLKGVKIEISMTNDQEISSNFQEIKVKISKGNYSQEVKKEKTIFVKRNKTTIELALIDVNLIKNALETLTTKVVNVYTIGAINQKITTNKLEILKAIKKLSNFPKDLNKVKIEIEDSEKLLPRNNEEPISVVIILSKNGVSKKVLGFKAKQMSGSQISNYDINLVKTTLESLNKKTIEVYTFDSIDQKITTNKLEILNEIEKLDGYPQDLKGVNVEVKNSNALLPLNNEKAINIILVLSKANALPNNIELEGFSVKQQLYVIEDIKSKIINKEILIKASVSTQSQQEIQSAILEQLKIENSNLTSEDISKISTNISSLDKGVRTEVELTITFKQRSKKIIIYVEKQNLLKGLDIMNGNSGKIFEDDFGNLWIMAIRQRILTPRLFVLRKKSNSWTKDTSSGLTKNSNITNGMNGTIFQDKFKNLWTMGTGTELQVLRANQNGDGYDEQTGWIKDTTDQLLLGSSITNGQNGTIFQDDFGNLWAMSEKTKLQVLRVNQNGDGYVTTGWSDNNQLNGEKLLKGSNIINGKKGVIFQDKFKNLWALGDGTSLQVLKANSQKDDYVNTGWISDNTTGLLNGSNIINGKNGTIFQDKFKNLWAMGSSITKDVDGTEKTFYTKLQVLKAKQDKDGYVNSWTDDNSNAGDSLLKNSNITNGGTGVIFQDKFKNLWTMASGTKLQLLKVNEDGNGYVDTGWINNNDKQDGKKWLKNSNILDGGEGIIFQDDFGNLWTMADSKLQVLKVNENDNGYFISWTDDDTATGLLKGSKILKGYAGVIFQDKSKNLWVMGANKKVQVLRIKLDNSYHNTWETSDT